MRKRHPPFRRRKLAKKLRKLRLRARMSIQEAAKALDKDVQALYRIEAGETRVDVHFGRSVMDVYDAYDPDLLDEIREAAKRGWWTTYGIKDQGYLDVETEAATVREFALALIPGLLQTKDYMRAVFASHGLVDNIENQIEVRRIRQQRLTSDDDPLFLHVIIDEYALRRLVGSPEIMRGQLRHLVDLAALPTVTLQVITSALHVGMMGTFIVLGFPDPDDPEVFYLEHVTGGSIHIEDPEQVRAANLAFGRLAAEALSPDESVALIERILAE
ncbi:helix-turn-helix transcriptional regulator [Lentzea sp.]|uniref:helix-turn-helix transcriptional regulator n=1 Tax=Lentzea sp. TaxID=56099 RepID=UPI002BA98B63|nr:helix-turn-helix transcriptional regulator [Lentzea sp.]HUQ54397.1 helix-turn-helix transcriptional regulator [Lentzea sp.]